VALKFEHKSSKGCNYGPPYEWQVYKSWIFLALVYGMFGITRHTRKFISRAGIMDVC
ncbi:casein kinase I isoform alpha, partial [Trifolium medium]|nr:casein kinase I isoform alpha [Trifolium medium]